MLNGATGPPPRADSPGAPTAPHDAAISVLLVDDTDRNLTALEAMLHDLDARLVKARSGEDALRALLHRDFALILLDVRMPGMDGFETARLIRARERNRHTPIIFLTAFTGNREQELQGYTFGAVDFLSKPVVPDVLRGKVSALIELHRRGEELRRNAALLREAEQRAHERELEAERRRSREQLLMRDMERERDAAAALQRANARLRVVSDATGELLRVRHPLEASARIFGGAAELGAEIALWYAGEELALAAHAGLDAAPEAELGAIPRGDPLVARALDERRPATASGPGIADASGLARALGARGCAVLPLASGGTLHGVLVLASRANPLAGEDLAALELVAERVASALDRARLVEELSRTAAELRDAHERKDQFLAMLGHELRNPLTPVANAVKLIQRRGSDDEAVVRVVAAADRQLTHMTRLLEDLLDVSRIQNGKIQLKRAPTDLREAIADAIQDLERFLRERRHTLEVTVPDERLDLEGDPVRLTQVVANLLQNAAKYTDAGGHIALTAARERDEIVVRVRDDGIGIDPAMLPRIFDVFVQAEQGRDRVRGGLGIGLTLVRKLVELHGGTVVARSEGLGRGSEFEVRLPAAAPATTAFEARPCDAAPAPGRPLRIAVVEDNADIRASLCALLEDFGHSVEMAGDGQRGIALVRDGRPDIALVDIGLPGLDGYAVARELRDAGVSTRLVAMTGYGRVEDRTRALEAGFHDHLVKPVDLQELTRLLAQPS